VKIYFKLVNWKIHHQKTRAGLTDYVENDCLLVPGKNDFMARSVHGITFLQVAHTLFWSSYISHVTKSHGMEFP